MYDAALVGVRGVVKGEGLESLVGEDEPNEGRDVLAGLVRENEGETGDGIGDGASMPFVSGGDCIGVLGRAGSAFATCATFPAGFGVMAGGVCDGDENMGEGLGERTNGDGVSAGDNVRPESKGK